MKLFDPLPRKRGTSLAEFSHYWLTHHAELAKEFRRIRRYIQSVRLEHKPSALGYPLGDTWCDGCAETWHDDAASVDAMAADPRFSELIDDEARFLDLTHPRFLLKTEERLLDEHGFDPRLRGVKVLIFVRRAANVSRSEFLTSWDDDAAVSLGRQLGSTRHVVCSSLGQVEREAAQDDAGAEGGVSVSAATSVDADDGYDGVRELWWPSMAHLESALAGDPRAAERLIRPHTIDVARSFALVAREPYDSSGKMSAAQLAEDRPDPLLWLRHVAAHESHSPGHGSHGASLHNPLTIATRVSNLDRPLERPMDVPGQNRSRTCRSRP